MFGLAWRTGLFSRQVSLSALSVLSVFLFLFYIFFLFCWRAEVLRRSVVLRERLRRVPELSPVAREALVREQGAPARERAPGEPLAAGRRAQGRKGPDITTAADVSVFFLGGARTSPVAVHALTPRENVSARPGSTFSLLYVRFSSSLLPPSKG